MNLAASVRWLAIAGLATACLATTPLAAQPASPTPDPPAAADPTAWRRWIERREGSEPFVWAEDPDGRVRVKVPTGWRVGSERTKDHGIKLFAIPANADPAAPDEAYILFIVPVPDAARVAPDGERIDMNLVARELARQFAASQMPGRKGELPAAQAIELDGCPAWEIALEPAPGKPSGVLRARGGDRAVAITIHLAVATTAAHRALFDHVDASLEFRLFAPRLSAWIPASWKGEAIDFGNRPAIAMGPRSLEQRPDPGAPRLVAYTLEGARLVGLDARTLAQNLALNLQNDHAGSAQPRALAGTDTIALGSAIAAREVLSAAATGELPASLVWFVVAKDAAQPYADVWTLYVSPAALAREEPRIRALLANARLAPFVPEPPPK